MRRIDKLTSNQAGISQLVLMENAGISLYYALKEKFSDLPGRCIGILCGKGNNGGDGIVLARQLAMRDIDHRVYLFGRKDEVSGEARVNLDAYLASGASLKEITAAASWVPESRELKHFDILVDALLGTGISKPLDGLYREVVESINSSRAFVLAVDIPSGMFSDSVEGGAPCVRANLTVTFTAPKIAHILNEDQEYIGELRVAPIGTPRQLLDTDEYLLRLLSAEFVERSLGSRRISSHKGDFGHVAIIAGSRGKSGAASLAGRAALRTGSGLVTVFCPEVVQPTIAGSRAELMTEGLASTAQGSLGLSAAGALLKALAERDAAGMGPGLTTHKETVRLVHRLVRESPVPLVLDADAVNAFAGQPEKLKNRHSHPMILTPHPGEFARLIGSSVAEVRRKNIELAKEFALKQRVWLVFKSFRTLIASPAGEVLVCPLGNPGMASAGVGDALTGIITSLLGMAYASKKPSVPEVTAAVCSAVYLHAFAGDLSSQQVGVESLNAGDLVEAIGEAYRRIHQS